MSKVREIIRYGCTTQLSERQIARALSVSRTVVARTLRAFHHSGLEQAAAAAMADSELQKRLDGERVPSPDGRYAVLAARFPQMIVELKKKGTTLEYLWEQYANEHPDAYQYSQFCRHFHRWRAADEVTMHVDYRGGEAMLVDWAGDKLRVVNGRTGEHWELEQFAAILGASQLTYVEARESQKEADWIRANEGALEYFGGSTQALIPDNTATAVSHADRYEPGINPVFDDFARHYGLVIMPARVRHLRDKALMVVEDGEEIALAQFAVHEHAWAVHAVALPQVVGELALESAPILGQPCILVEPVTFEQPIETGKRDADPRGQDVTLAGHLQQHRKARGGKLALERYQGGFGFGVQRPRGPPIAAYPRLEDLHLAAGPLVA